MGKLNEIAQKAYECAVRRGKIDPDNDSNNNLPVSYTHLDVYKRQIVKSAVMFMPETVRKLRGGGI